MLRSLKVLYFGLSSLGLVVAVSALFRTHMEDGSEVPLVTRGLWIVFYSSLSIIFLLSGILESKGVTSMSKAVKIYLGWAKSEALGLSGLVVILLSAGFYIGTLIGRMVFL